MKIGATLCYILLFGTLLAQKAPHQAGFPAPPHQEKWQSLEVWNTDKALAWAERHLLPHPAYTFSASGQRKAQTATYHDFSIKHQGHPVYGLHATARHFKNGRVRWSAPLLPTPEEGATSFPARQAVIKLIEQRGWKAQGKPQRAWFVQQETLIPAYALRVKNARQAPLQVLTNGQEILWMRDERRFFGDSTVTGMVFYPDPLTTANVNYGGNFVDAGDADKPALNNERQSVSFKADYQGGTFYLRNSKIRLIDFEAPNITPVTSSSPKFNYTRGQSGFEDVNTFYHLSTFDAYIDSLGYPQIPGNQITVDPHGAQGADQSYFQPGNDRLSLGPGGVDDAEDADVIVHEWTHAMAKYTAAPGNGTTERAMLEEALGDYFALSYSRHLNGNQDDKIFNWDGHNEFWPGRQAVSTKNYQQLFFSGSIYAHTDLMVSCLREIHSQVGRQKSDKLVVESMFALTTSTTFEDFAFEMLRNDSLLYGERHRQAIADAFIRRQVLPNWVGLSQAKPRPDIAIYNTLGWMRGEALMLKSKTGLKAARVYNLRGQMVYHRALGSSEKAALVIPGLKAGAYLLEVETTSGEREREKLIRR